MPQWPVNWDLIQRRRRRSSSVSRCALGATMLSTNARYHRYLQIQNRYDNDTPTWGHSNSFRARRQCHPAIQSLSSTTASTTSAFPTTSMSLMKSSDGSDDVLGATDQRSRPISISSTLLVDRSGGSDRRDSNGRREDRRKQRQKRRLKQQQNRDQMHPDQSQQTNLKIPSLQHP